MDALDIFCIGVLWKQGACNIHANINYYPLEIETDFKSGQWPTPRILSLLSLSQLSFGQP